MPIVPLRRVSPDLNIWREKPRAQASLSAAFLASLAAPKEGRLVIGDPKVPGLLLRVTPTGPKSWSMMYRRGVPQALALHDRQISPSRSGGGRKIATRALIVVAGGAEAG